MPKLHELVAANVSLQTQAQKLRLELQSTFDKKRHLFASTLATLTPLAEGSEVEVRAQSDIQSTVAKEIEWLMNTVLVKAIDSGFTIDHTNTLAKADIVLEDGTVFAKDVPATALLQLEHRLKEMSELIKTIPTLDPAKGFTLDKSAGEGIYKAREIVKPSTKKDQHPLVLVEATKEHPAQVQLVTEDVKVGVIREQEWSSLITPATKADLLERAENLFRVVRQARSRANDHQIDKEGVQTQKIGEKLLRHIFAPLSSLSLDKVGQAAP
jgi:hypothetical protein